jgi:pimeloyl-ACP methyl ester carboxylesterase
MSAACRSAGWSPSASRRHRPAASCRWHCATPPTASARRWDDRVAAVTKGGLESIADAVLKVWFTQDFLAQHPDAARGMANMLVRTPAEGYIGCCLALRDADLRADDARIDCPTLVIVGDQDVATSPAAARELSAAIRGARLEVLAQAAHIPTVEQPAAVSRLLGAFFDTQAAPARREKATGRV